MYSFDWSHACAGRLSAFSLSPERRADAAARLADELTAGELPFLDLPYADELCRALTDLEPRLHGCKHMLVLGIGGSALGARALQKAFFPQQDRPGHAGPWLWILDNVDPAELEAMLNGLSPAETLVVVISKSGGTIETLSQYFFVRDWLRNALAERWTEHLLLVTDARNGFLREEARRLDCLSLPVPDHLGGRYSALSAVGLVPAAFLGLPWRDLIAGAREVNAALTARPGPNELAAHPAWKLAEWAYSLAQNGYNQLIFFMYIPAWAAFGQWFAQLWAESLGKNGRGTMPLAAVGVTDQHSLQQMFLDGPRDKGCIQIFSTATPGGPVFPPNLPDAWKWLENRPFGDLLDAECLGAAAALTHHKTPLTRLAFSATDARAAGSLMGLCMAATLFTGWLLDINPLDQPAVELGKRLACARLGAQAHEEERRLLAAYAGRTAS